MASRFGWAAVAGPSAMNFGDLRLGLQLIAEETVGRPMRRRVYEAKAEEDEAVGKAASALRGGR